MVSQISAHETFGTACRKCESPLVRAQVRGGRESLAFALGSDIWRCLSCESRFIYFRQLSMTGYTDRRRFSNIAIGWLAILAGLVICLGIAALILRRFHRWPF